MAAAARSINFTWSSYSRKETLFCDILGCGGRYAEDLTENREIYIPTCIRRVNPASFAKMFSAGKTRAIGLPYTLPNRFCPDPLMAPFQRNFAWRSSFFHRVSVMGQIRVPQNVLCIRNAAWASTSGSFGIVTDTLVSSLDLTMCELHHIVAFLLNNIK